MSKRRSRDPDTDPEGNVAERRQKISNIIRRRTPKDSIANKTKWALYRHEYINNLIGETSKLVNQLITLFPSAQPSKRGLLWKTPLKLQEPRRRY